MTSRNLDPVLARQLKRLALPAELQGSAEWERFLDSINEHYVHMNDDRALLSRSIELSTQEMDGLRRRLEAQRDNSLSLIVRALLLEVAVKNRPPPRALSRPDILLLLMIAFSTIELSSTVSEPVVT